MTQVTSHKSNMTYTYKLIHITCELLVQARLHLIIILKAYIVGQNLNTHVIFLSGMIIHIFLSLLTLITYDHES